MTAPLSVLLFFALCLKTSSGHLTRLLPSPTAVYLLLVFSFMTKKAVRNLHSKHGVVPHLVSWYTFEEWARRDPD